MTNRRWASGIPGAVFAFLLFMLATDAFIGLMVYQQLRIGSWPTVVGRVESVSAELDSAGPTEPTFACPQVTFSYEVAGTAYRNDTIRYRGSCSPGTPSVDALLENLAPGSEVVVRHDPEEPQEAYLLVGLGPLEHTVLLFFLPFNLLALGCLAFFGSLHPRGRWPRPNPLQIDEGFGRSVVRFPRLGPAWFTLAVLTVLSFFLGLLAIILLEVLPGSFYRILWPGLGLLALALFIGKAMWNRFRPLEMTLDQEGSPLKPVGGARDARNRG